MLKVEETLFQQLLKNC